MCELLTTADFLNLEFLYYCNSFDKYIVEWVHDMDVNRKECIIRVVNVHIQKALLLSLPCG